MVVVGNQQAKRGEKFNPDKLMLDADLHDDERIDFKENVFPGIDVNKNFRVSRILNLITNVKIDLPDSNVHISVKYNANPVFLKRSRLYNYVQLTFIALYPDFEDNMIDIESAVLPVREITDIETYSFSLNIPVGAKGYLLFCKVEACGNGVCGDAFPKAMALISSDNL